MRIKTLSDEVQVVNHALLALHKPVLPPPQINDSVSNWRKIALLHLGGQVNGSAPERSDILQACGQINGVIYQVVKRDNSGRPVTKFYGDASTCWRPFGIPARRLAGISTRRQP